MTQMQTRQSSPKDIGQLLQSKAMLNQLRLALPKHITPERLARIVLTQIRQTPALLKCRRESLLGAILQAAQLGLEPGTLGQCWILPYGKDATFIVGYRGMAQLAWRSGQVAGLSSRAVFEGDVFDYDFGEDKISHKPGGETDPAKLTHVYAVVHTTYGGRIWDVMTRAEVDGIRKRSPAGNRGPWVTDYTEMAKKTVFRRLMKIGPCSVEMQTAMTLDDAADRGISQGIDFDIDVEATDEPELEELPAGEQKGAAPADETTAPAQPMVAEAIRKRAEMFQDVEAAADAIRRAVYAEFGDLSKISGPAIVKASNFAHGVTPKGLALKGAKS